MCKIWPTKKGLKQGFLDQKTHSTKLIMKIWPKGGGVNPNGQPARKIWFFYDFSNWIYKKRYHYIASLQWYKPWFPTKTQFLPIIRKSAQARERRSLRLSDIVYVKKKQNALRKRKIKAEKEKDEEKIAMLSIDVFKVCVHWKNL